MKYLFILWGFAFSVQDEPQNVLKFLSETDYSEKITCDHKAGKGYDINIEVEYNRQGSVDEENTRSLRLVLPASAKAGDTFNISADEGSVKCHYELSSAWIWPNPALRDQNNMKGMIKIASQSRKTFVIELDLAYNDGPVVYKGERKIRW